MGSIEKVFEALRACSGGGICRPSVRYLAGAAGLHERTVRNCLAQLRAAGRIDWKRTGRTSVYRLVEGWAKAGAERARSRGNPVEACAEPAEKTPDRTRSDRTRSLLKEYVLLTEKTIGASAPRIPPQRCAVLEGSRLTDAAESEWGLISRYRDLLERYERGDLRDLPRRPFLSDRALAAIRNCWGGNWAKMLRDEQKFARKDFRRAYAGLAVLEVAR